MRLTSPRSDPEEPLLVLGETTFRNQHRRFGLLPVDRTRHLYLLGKTGSGKSTLLSNLIVQDLQRNVGISVLDPHGDLIDSVLPHVPPSRTNDVVLFSPEDTDFPLAFNVFRQGRRPHPNLPLLAGQLVSVFRRQWADSWGPRLEHVLRNAILAVAPDPRATLLFLYRFLTDERLRSNVASAIRDPVVRQFWLREFPGYSKNLQSEALSPVLNKLGAFVTNPTVRAIVGQERSRLDLMTLMQNRGIVLANLSSGRIGESASHLLGGLLLSSLQLSAMERRRGGPLHIAYVDEFQHFVTDSLATLLSESRKFGLGLVLAHQYLGQLPDGLRDAILGNIGSLVVFRLGSSDAATLESEFAPVFTRSDLQAFERYHVAVRMLARGESLPPFSARTLSAITRPDGAEERIMAIRAQSRARFASRRVDVETSIGRVFEHQPPPG